MPNTQTDYERGYLLGFYNALKGVSFVAGAAQSIAEIRDAVDETIQEMIESGEAKPGTDGTADGLIDVVTMLNEMGIDPEPFLDALSEVNGGK